MRRLDALTAEYGEDNARELRRIYSGWSDLLRSDRALTPALASASEGRRESSDANGEPGLGERPAERRLDIAH